MDRSQSICNLCEVTLPIGGDALLGHINSRQHRLNLYQNIYTKNRESMLKPKQGIQISAVPCLNSPFTRIKEKNGKICMFLQRGCGGSAAIQIHNTNSDKAVILHQVEPLYPCPSIRLSDQHHVITRRVTLKLNKNDKYLIRFEALANSTGVHEMPLVFQFTRENSTDVFFILRILCVEYPADVSIKTFVTTPEVDLSTESILAYPPRAGTYVRGHPVGNLLLPDSYLWAYYYPEKLRELVSAKFNIKRIKDPLLIKENYQMTMLMKKGLQPTNYCKWFQTQLWIEEIQQEENLRWLHLKNVFMRRSTNLNLLELEVPGVMDDRPSLKAGISIFFRPAGASTPIYEGIVHHVTGETVSVGLALDFVASFREGTRMDVQFWFTRTNLIRSHKALRLCDHIKHVLFPRYPQTPCPKQTKALQYYDTRITRNFEQQQAVRAVVYKVSAPAPYVLFGPPGTGKTLTIVEAIKQVYKLYRDCRILMSAPTNSACDVVAERLLDHIPEKDIHRIYATSRDEESIPNKLRPISYTDDGNIFMPSTQNISKFKVIVATFLTSAKVIPVFNNSTHVSSVFTHIFMDECGHGTEPEALIPLLGLGETVVLAGDHQQLGPLVFSRICSTNNRFFTNYGLDQSLLERLMNLDLYKPDETGSYNPRLVTKLLDNYRSHGDILKISNDLFYHSELRVSSDPAVTHSLLGCHLLPNKAVPLIFHGVNGRDDREGNNPSYFNIHEIAVVVGYVRELVFRLKVDPNDIGIVVPYKAQTKKIRAELADRLDFLAEGLLVGSPEQFQGNERLVIIVSTVRASAELLYNDVLQQLGFLCNAKRFNVAVTRAQALLVVVGCPWLLQRDRQWGALLKYCIMKGCYKGCPYTALQDGEVDEIGRAMDLLQIQELQHKKKSRGRNNKQRGTDQTFSDDEEGWQR